MKYEKKMKRSRYILGKVFKFWIYAVEQEELGCVFSRTKLIIILNLSRKHLATLLRCKVTTRIIIRGRQAG